MASSEDQDQGQNAGSNPLTTPPVNVLDVLRKGLEADPQWTYGNVLPMARNNLTGAYSPAMPGALRSFLQGGVDLLEGTGTGQVTQKGFGTLLGMAGGDLTLGAKPAGSLGIFGGKLGAARHPLLQEQLGKAEALQAQGLSQDTIFNQTGWFKGADSKWRFEVPDTGAKLTNPELLGEGTLGQYLEHPALYSVYPELKGAPLSVVDNLAYNGSYTPGGGLQLLRGTRTPEEMLSTILHESQHGIQDIEGR